MSTVELAAVSHTQRYTRRFVMLTSRIREDALRWWMLILDRENCTATGLRRNGAYGAWSNGSSMCNATWND